MQKSLWYVSFMVGALIALMIFSMYSLDFGVSCMEEMGSSLAATSDLVVEPKKVSSVANPLSHQDLMSLANDGTLLAAANPMLTLECWDAIASAPSEVIVSSGPGDKSGPSAKLNEHKKMLEAWLSHAGQAGVALAGGSVYLSLESFVWVSQVSYLLGNYSSVFGVVDLFSGVDMTWSSDLSLFKLENMKNLYEVYSGAIVEVDKSLAGVGPAMSGHPYLSGYYWSPELTLMKLDLASKMNKSILRKAPNIVRKHNLTRRIKLTLKMSSLNRAKILELSKKADCMSFSLKSKSLELARLKMDSEKLVDNVAKLSVLEDMLKSTVSLIRKSSS
nr:hypothetical protein [Donax trunculus]